jgi:alpha-1,3-glucan synthase
MVLLQTLTRVQIAFTLISAQVLGSVMTIVARSDEPNKLGLGDVFPNFRRGCLSGCYESVVLGGSCVGVVCLCRGF